MARWFAFVTLVAAFQSLLATAQDFSGVHEVTSGPEGAPVICLLLHGAAFSSATWSEETDTMATLAAAGIKAVAIDIPGTNLSPALPTGTDSLGLIPHFIDKYRVAGEDQASIVVAPSMSGGTAHPYIISLTAETAGDLDAYVPVAPVAVSVLEDATIDPEVLENLRVYGIYGGEDSGSLPDLPVLESIFPNFGSTVVPGGGHPVYLDDPELFNSLLIELAQNITSTPLSSAAAPAAATDTAGTSTTGGAATSPTDATATSGTATDDSATETTTSDDAPADAADNTDTSATVPGTSAAWTGVSASVMWSIVCVWIMLVFRIS